MAKKNDKGFTLIEMMVVIFLGGLLLVVILSIYVWHNSVYNYQQALVKTSEAGRRSLTSMQTYVSQAYRVLATSTVNSTLYSSDSQTLVLQLPSVDNAGSVVPSKWDVAVFYSASGKLFVAVSPDAGSFRPRILKQISDSLNSLVFTYDNADFNLVKKITVALNNSMVVKNQTVSQNITQDMYLYNYY